MDQDRAIQGLIANLDVAFANILLGGVFHAAVLFLVAAGLQLVFGVQKILNLACGSFYALGAYFGITFIGYARAVGLSPWLHPARAHRRRGSCSASSVRRSSECCARVYGRDESFQLLLTFALVLMFQDVFRFIWGANPRSLDSAYSDLRHDQRRRFQRAGLQSAGDRGGDRRRGRARRLLCKRTNYGRILRATAENRAMAEALGVDVRRVYSVVFTLGTVLGTTAGALVVPTAAASLDMAIEFVIEAFAVVVIGGLGSMRGALVGALIVGLIRALFDRALSRAGSARDLRSS